PTRSPARGAAEAVASRPGATLKKPAPPIPRAASTRIDRNLQTMGLRLITAGESHGPELTCVVEGMPAGLELERESLDRDLASRRPGWQAARWLRDSCARWAPECSRTSSRSPASPPHGRKE